MQTIITKLNGYTKGFCLYIYDNDEFVMDKKTKKKKLFRNLEECKLYAYQNISPNGYYYRIWMVFDKLEVPFDNVEFHNGYYEYYDLQHMTLYKIQESNIEYVTSIGYFVFNDGDNPESEIKISKNQSNKYFNILLSALNAYVNTGEFLGEALKQDGNNNMMLKFKNSSIKFHLLYNSQIMDLNIQRREQKIRCIPYLKSMDKYKTVYIYTTGLLNYEDDLSIINEVIGNVLEYVLHNTNYACKYVPVEYNGIIKIEG